MLVLSTGVGSALGFVYWVVAANLLSPAEVGVGAAMFAAIAFAAAIGELGVGWTLLRFAGSTARPFEMINSAVVISTIATAAVSALFIVSLPLWDSSLVSLLSWSTAALFIAGSSLAATTYVADRAIVAMGTARWVLVRGVMAGALRIASLGVLGDALGAEAILWSVAIAAGITSIFSALILPRLVPAHSWLLGSGWRSLAERSRYSAGNYLASLVWAVPTFVLPLIALQVVGPSANARFYLAWMVANLVYVVPISVGTVVLARVGRGEGFNADAIRTITIGTTVLAALSALAAVIAAPPLFRFLAVSYFDQGTLTILAIAVVPYTFNVGLITAERVRLRSGRALVLSALPVVLGCLAAAPLGAGWGVAGIAYAWLGGQFLGAASGGLLHLLFRRIDSHPLSGLVDAGGANVPLLHDRDLPRER